MPNTGRTTNANGNGARNLQEKPPNSSAKNPACQAGAVVPNSQPKNFTLSVRGDGREIFLPPLNPDRLYQVTVQGTFAFWEQGFIFGGPKTHADGLYKADHAGNFVREHSWLSFDGLPLRYKESLQEDREVHRYTFRFYGKSKRISARLDIEGQTQSDFRTEGALTIEVELLPENTPSPFPESQYDFHKRLTQQKLAAEQKANEKKTADERAALESDLRGLQCRAHRENYFFNADFQQKYARHHLQEISSKLKGEWASEYDALMQQPGFKQFAAQQAPEVIQWLESRVNIARLAEEMIASPPALQSQKKPKLNADQVRALKVRRDGIQAEDRIARTKLKAEKLLKARAELEPFPLDPDEKESLGTELAQEIRDIGEEERIDGKRGTTF